MKYVVDVETERLINPQQVWCVVAKEVETTGRVHVWTAKDDDSEWEALKEKLEAAEQVIGHNFIDFDWGVLRRLMGLSLRPDRILDTLVLSRVYYFGVGRKREHSLDAWGQRLGHPKSKHNEFHEFSQELVDRCIGDVEINTKLYHLLHKKTNNEMFREAIDIEHKMAWVCLDMHRTGFRFNEKEANQLHEELTKRVESLDEELREAFPPKAKPVREITPKQTKAGTVSKVGLQFLGDDLTPVRPDCPFTKIEWQTFNPGSHAQVVARLNDSGWRPTEKTTGHIEAERSRDKERLAQYKQTGWKVSENNLRTLPEDAPEAAHKLVERLILASRRSTLEEWFRAYSPASGRIHGKFNHIGSWPHRMSHAKPNMGNVPTRKSTKYHGEYLASLAKDYGERLRSLWIADDGCMLVGTDASSIHLRILAHLTNDKDMIEGVLYGDKKDGTDIHTRNAKALGPLCDGRDTAKTFIYSFINGAGIPKVGDILGCAYKDAEVAVENFYKSYEGLDRFRRDQLRNDIGRGYFFLLDGRPIKCPSEHKLIAGYLQGGEQAIMKHANIRWRRHLKQRGVPFKQVNFIHDEWQTEIPNNKELAKYVGEIQVDALRAMTDKFNLNCAIDGETRYGYTWFETH